MGLEVHSQLARIFIHEWTSLRAHLKSTYFPFAHFVLWDSVRICLEGRCAFSLKEAGDRSVTDMIEKLKAEAKVTANKKAYCDKELAETKTNKDDMTTEIEKLMAKIKQQAVQCQTQEGGRHSRGELAAVVREQAEMDKIHAEEKAQREANSAQMEKGLNGIMLAFKVLNE